MITNVKPDFEALLNTAATRLFAKIYAHLEETGEASIPTLDRDPRVVAKVERLFTDLGFKTEETVCRLTGEKRIAIRIP